MSHVVKNRSVAIALGSVLAVAGGSSLAHAAVSVWSEDFSGTGHSLNNENDFFNNFAHDTVNDYLSVDWRRHSSARYWAAHDLAASETLTEQTSFGLSFDIRMLTRVAPEYAGVRIGRVGVFDVPTPANQSGLEDAAGVYFEIAMGPLFTGSAYWQGRGVVVDSNGDEHVTAWRSGLLIEEPAANLEAGGGQTYQITLNFDAGTQTLSLAYDDSATVYSVVLPENTNFTGNAVGVQTPFIGVPTGVLATGWVDSFTLVPEPASMALTSLGMAFIMLRGRSGRTSTSE